MMTHLERAFEVSWLIPAALLCRAALGLEADAVSDFQTSTCVRLLVSDRDLRTGLSALRCALPHLSTGMSHLSTGVPHLRTGVPHLRTGVAHLRSHCGVGGCVRQACICKARPNSGVECHSPCVKTLRMRKGHKVLESVIGLLCHPSSC